MATREEAIHVLALLSDGVPIVQSCKELWNNQEQALCGD